MNGAPRAERDSEEVERVIDEYLSHQVLAMRLDPSCTIKTDKLPLARIKRIMKQDSCDPHPRMVSSEAIPLMAYAAQLFIGSVVKLAWKQSTKPAKRNTLQLKDIKRAVQSSSRFDFLIDIIDKEFDDGNASEEETTDLRAPTPRQSVPRLQPVNHNPDVFVDACLDRKRSRDDVNTTANETAKSELTSMQDR